MLTPEQIAKLREPFPPEALSADRSRGFELTSIKAAFVIERLNETFGLCGIGWRYVHTPFEIVEGEVVTEVAFQYRVGQDGVDPVVWDSQTRHWAFIPDSGAWSWPILAAGGKRIGKGSAPVTDARKSAVTDGLTKAASMIGVGHQVFKGLVRSAGRRPPKPAGQSQAAQGNGKPRPATPKPPAQATDKGQARPAVTPKPASKANGAAVDRSNGASATTFWRKANRHTELLDRATVSELARGVQRGAMTWLEAENLLDDLIDQAAMPVIESRPANAPAKVADPLDELFA